MENGILVEIKKKFEDESPTSSSKMSPTKLKWVPHDISEFFFFDDFGFLNFTDKKVMECYAEFTETMRETYDKMVTIYTQLVTKNIREEDLAGCDFAFVPNAFELKGLEHYLGVIRGGSPVKEKREKVEEKEEDKSEQQSSMAACESVEEFDVVDSPDKSTNSSQIKTVPQLNPTFKQNLSDNPEAAAL